MGGSGQRWRQTNHGSLQSCRVELDPLCQGRAWQPGSAARSFEQAESPQSLAALQAALALSMRQLFAWMEPVLKAPLTDSWLVLKGLHGLPQ